MLTKQPLATTTTTTAPFLQSPTARTIVAISIMSVVLLVSNHILDGTALPLPAPPQPPNQTLSYESFFFFFVIVLPTGGKKKTSLTPTCFPSFFSSHTRLLTPTPFLSALFKSKQKTHLVCLLAPSFSYFLFCWTTSFFFFFSLQLFSAASIRVKDNILLALRAGRSLVGGTVACLTFFFCCNPYFHGYKLMTKCYIQR